MTASRCYGKRVACWPIAPVTRDILRFLVVGIGLAAAAFGGIALLSILLDWRELGCAIDRIALSAGLAIGIAAGVILLIGPAARRHRSRVAVLVGLFVVALAALWGLDPPCPYLSM